MRQICIKIMQIAVILLITNGLTACGSHLYHVVERGETLSSISWMYGHDYQKVAQWNQVKPPYVIREGQRLRVAALETGSAKGKRGKREQLHKVNSRRTDIKNERSNPVQATGGPAKQAGGGSARQRLNRVIVWQWPAVGGRVVERFDARDPGKRGVDIQGRVGQPVFAASRGRVVYSGSGLPRYGKLIIVKHSDVYLSAYAHNKALFVREGDSVNQGQHIADMGSSGASSTKLHFEIRRNGKAVDPLRLLPKTRP
jgi:lipoprotein NlpD